MYETKIEAGANDCVGLTKNRIPFFMFNVGDFDRLIRAAIYGNSFFGL